MSKEMISLTQAAIDLGYRSGGINRSVRANLERLALRAGIPLTIFATLSKRYVLLPADSRNALRRELKRWQDEERKTGGARRGPSSLARTMEVEV